jgi:hypothetical protein
MVGLLVFTYGLARGVDGGSRERAFWAGLGAAPASMELGVVLVDLVFMALVSGVGWLVGPDDPVFLVLGAGAGLVTYGLGSATRSAARSESGRFGLVLAMLLVMALNTAVAFAASYGHLVVGVALQLGIVASVGLVSRVLLSARSPESAAGRGRRSWSWLGAALAGLLVVPIQFAEGKPDSTSAVSDAAGLFVPDGDPMAGKQLWRVGANGEPERLSLRGRVFYPEPGPRGSATFFHKDLGAVASVLLEGDRGREGSQRSMTVSDGLHFGMLTADGGSIACDGPLLSGTTTFDADGMGATRTLPSGESWRLDADGCRLLPEDTP